LKLQNQQSCIGVKDPRQPGQNRSEGAVGIDLKGEESRGIGFGRGSKQPPGKLCEVQVGGNLDRGRGGGPKLTLRTTLSLYGGLTEKRMGPAGT